MFKTAEREKERTKGGERKEYKIKITRVKRREIFPLIYTHQYNYNYTHPVDQTQLYFANDKITYLLVSNLSHESLQGFPWLVVI